MAQERTLGTARAVDSSDGADETKAELERQMDKTRESISHTVNEIKETVTYQYQHAKESVVEALDWKEYFKKQPFVWSAGAVGVGLILGYAVTGIIKDSFGGNGGRDVRDRNSNRGTGDLDEQPDLRSHARGMEAIDFRPSYSSGYSAPSAPIKEPEEIGMIDRLKSSRAYDRVKEEAAKIGEDVLEKAAATAKTVLLPMLFAKLGDLVRTNLSGLESPGTPGQKADEPVGNRYEPVSEQAAMKPSTESAAESNRYPRPTSAEVTSNRVRHPSDAKMPLEEGASFASGINQVYGIEAKDREGYIAKE